MAKPADKPIVVTIVADHVEEDAEISELVTRLEAEAERDIAALRSVANADLEAVSLSTNPEFLDLIERSRARQQAEGGILSEEMRRRLDTPPAPAHSKTQLERRSGDDQVRTRR
jgi:hypothetical protein